MEWLRGSRLSWEEVEMLRGIRLSWEEAEAEVCPEAPPKAQSVPAEGEQGTPMWRPSGRELRVKVTRRRRMRDAAGADAGCGSAGAAARPSSGCGMQAAGDAGVCDRSGEVGATRPSPGGVGVRLEEPVGFGGGGPSGREVCSFGGVGAASGQISQACTKR